MEKKAILCVSFGTSHGDTLALTIGAIEQALADAFPAWTVRRAFTSGVIKRILKRRDNVDVDNVSEALERLLAEGYDTVVVQPTYVMGGAEYDRVAESVSAFEGRFNSLSMGKPLLTDDSDYIELADALAEYVKNERSDDTAMVFMGHGTEHGANGTYAKLQSVMCERGYGDFFIGTVEATPSVYDVLDAVGVKKYKSVTLRPLMIVAGDHAKNDMAGDGEDSWKSIFTAAGFAVTCVTEGLGQIEAVRKMFVKHAEKAMGEQIGS